MFKRALEMDRLQNERENSITRDSSAVVFGDRPIATPIGLN
jgi:hypothetical protein